MSLFCCNLKVGSLFPSDNSEPKIIFLDLFLDCQYFWYQKFKI